ncbi:MAG: 2-amino-4-hydroxy-6-hydroxymethyldihydropteridine diphosphokinase [Betaproteobacteria bacterium]
MAAHDRLPAPVRAFVGLGANVGDTRRTLEAALRSLAVLPLTTLERRSSWWRSAPIDAGGPDYVNAVAELSTELGAADLLGHLLDIERLHGRERPYRNAPRTLDLDLLLYGDARIDTPSLTVPHPRMHERAFVLAPLAEVWPALEVPGRGRVDALLAGVADQRVERLSDGAA